MKKKQQLMGFNDFLGNCRCVYSVFSLFSLSVSLSLSSSSGQVPSDHLGSLSPSMACLQFKEKAVRDQIRHYTEILPLRPITP